MGKIKILNVYDEVNEFYNNLSAQAKRIISSNMVVGFLRNVAWQGVNDNILREYWHDLRPLVDYLANNKEVLAEELRNITSFEYVLIFEWMKGRVANYNASFQQIARILGVWHAFFYYLLDKKQINSIDEFAEAVELIAQIGKTGKQPKQGEPLFDSMLNKWVSMRNKEMRLPEMVGDDDNDFEIALAEKIEQLLNDIVDFYGQDDYKSDMQRALWLFNGPLGIQHDYDDGDFWGSFWDWFIFDYHLLSNDLTPVQHYSLNGKQKWSEFEKQIFNELQSLRYRVFFIESIKNGSWVNCRDLLTDEKFVLPYPDLDLRNMKKVLFYGRMSDRDNVLLNYLSSITVSSNMRRRVKDELSKMKELFCAQKSQASWDEFFARHSHLVRHTVEMLANYTAINVAPVEQLQKKICDELIESDERVIAELRHIMPAVGFSQWDFCLATKIWQHFFAKEHINIRKPSLWAVAIVNVFITINALKISDTKYLTKWAGVTQAAINQAVQRMITALEVEPYDIRYLNEDGFMMYLFNGNVTDLL